MVTRFGLFAIVVFGHLCGVAVGLMGDPAVGLSTTAISGLIFVVSLGYFHAGRDSEGPTSGSGGESTDTEASSSATKTVSAGTGSAANPPGGTPTDP